MAIPIEGKGKGGVSVTGERLSIVVFLCPMTSFWRLHSASAGTSREGTSG